MTSDPTTPQPPSRAPDGSGIETYGRPQTAEQVVKGVLGEHGALGYDDIDGCECGADVRTHEAHRAHQAAEVVAALGLREEWGVPNAVGVVVAWPGRELASRAAEITDHPLMVRDVIETDWRPVDA